MGDIFDFLYEENENEIYDLVLLIYNPNLKIWLKKLQFMKLRYKVISDKYFQNKDLNSESVVFINGKLINNLWIYIYNNFKSFNYAIIGENDTPENFDIMYLDFLNKGGHISINNNMKLYDKFNVSFNMINDFIDVPGSSYMIFKSNYLKFCIMNDNGMNLRHRLLYYKNLYNDKIKSDVVEFMGCNTPVNNRAKKKIFLIRLSKYRMLFPSLIVMMMEVILIMINDMEFFKNMNIIMGIFMFVFLVVDSFVEEVY